MKGIIVLFMRERFSKAQKMMDLMDVRCTKMEEKFQVHRSAALCNRVVVIYHDKYFGYLTMAVTGALVIGKTPFCLHNPLVNPVDHFYLATAIESVTMIGIILANLILDVYPIIYVVMLRIHLRSVPFQVDRGRTSI